MTIVSLASDVRAANELALAPSPPPPAPPPASTPHWFTPLQEFLRWERELLATGAIPRPFDFDPFGHDQAPVTQEIERRKGVVCLGGMRAGADVLNNPNEDSLELPWGGLVAYANPGPYKARYLKRVIAKIDTERGSADPPAGLAALLPNWRDRGWWRPIRAAIDAGQAVATDFEGRFNFGWPECPGGHPRRSAMFPSVLVVWRGDYGVVAGGRR